MVDAWLLATMLAGRTPNLPQIMADRARQERCAVPLVNVLPPRRVEPHPRFRVRVLPPEPMPNIVPLPSCRPRPEPQTRGWYPEREQPLPGPNPR